MSLNFSKKVSPLILVFSFLLFISQIALPALSRHDLFIFSDWRMYAPIPRHSIYDLTWDGGRTYLFRDYIDNFKQFERQSYLVFFAVDENNHLRLKNDFLDIIKKFCGCSEVEIHELKTSYYSHVLLKRQSEVIQSKTL